VLKHIKAHPDILDFYNSYLYEQLANTKTKAFVPTKMDVLVDPLNVFTDRLRPQGTY
jgi:hypothetical protein